MTDDVNMALRKYLKEVGVTSQRAIEDALRERGEPGRRYAVRTTLAIEELGLEHVGEGTLPAGREEPGRGPA